LASNERGGRRGHRHQGDPGRLIRLKNYGGIETNSKVIAYASFYFFKIRKVGEIYCISDGAAYPE
jgi:hypothetical protein